MKDCANWEMVLMANHPSKETVQATGTGNHNQSKKHLTKDKLGDKQDAGIEDLFLAMKIYFMILSFMVTLIVLVMFLAVFFLPFD